MSLRYGIESALDFQSAYSIIYPQKLRLYQVGDGVNMDSVGTFNIWLDALDASYCTYEGGDQPYLGELNGESGIGLSRLSIMHPNATTEINLACCQRPRVS